MKGNYYLIHHGIKGQKWGVRRYQNEDGSLTPAGLKRYARDYSKSGGTSVSDEFTNEVAKVYISDSKNKDTISKFKKQNASNLKKYKSFLESKEIKGYSSKKDKIRLGDALEKARYDYENSYVNNPYYDKIQSDGVRYAESIFGKYGNTKMSKSGEKVSWDLGYRIASSILSEIDDYKGMKNDIDKLEEKLWK